MRCPSQTLAAALLVLVASPTPSDARPGATCAKVCQRVASCKLFSYRLCMQLCDKQGAEDRPESRAKNLAQARMSCPALAANMLGTSWLCTAEGSAAYGRDMEGSAPDEWGRHHISMIGLGATRTIASTNALKDCNEIMTLQLEVSAGDRTDSTIASACRITRCIAPARSSR